MCAFFQHFTFTYKTQLRLIVPCPGAPPGSHNTESDMIVLQYVFHHRLFQSSFTLDQSQSWGVVRISQVNVKEAKTQNISGKQNQHVPGAGLKPSLMARCSFLLHSRSLWASPFSSMLRPPINGADPSTSAHQSSLEVVPVFICMFHRDRNVLNLSPGTCRPSNPISHFLFSCITN